MATKRKLTGLRRPECDVCNERALYEITTLTRIRHYCGRCYLLITDFKEQLIPNTGDTSHGNLSPDA